jgi:glutamyl-tRNA reductase
MQKIIDRVFSKFLHTPFTKLKDTAYLKNDNTIGDILEYLFDENNNIEIKIKGKSEK